MSNKSKKSQSTRSQNSNNGEADLEAKKKKLEAELERIEQELDTSVDEMRTGLTDQLHPRNLIERYPLQALGSSVLLGLLLGYKGGSDHNHNGAGGRSLFSMVWREFKSTATRRAVRSFFNYLDTQLDEQLGANGDSPGDKEEE